MVQVKKTDVNGHNKGILPVLPEEIDHYEGQVRKFRQGEVDPTAFRVFRLRHGVYGQRQPDVQMFRVKIPSGILTAEQLDALGTVARDYTPLKRGHFTTRENLQYHYLQLDQSAEIMRILGESGLSSREACGNTVRNVAGCPVAGVCPTEPFDTTPYIAAYARYFIRHPLTQNMPRKFKTAFSGCTSDCALTAIHDLGFIAQVRQENGTPRKGFKMVVGGGLSIMPRVAPTLFDFVPVEEYLRVSEAIIRIFDRSEELRKNRMKARIKFLVDRIGIDAFRSLVEEELKGNWAKHEYDLEALSRMGDEEDDAPSPDGSHEPAPKGDLQFQRWVSSNVSPQRQPGFNIVNVTLTLGNVTAEQLFALADITRNYSGGRSRTTQRQNLCLRWVRQKALYSLYKDLKAVDLADPGAQEITDVVSCPGTESCSLGITASMGMAGHLKEFLKGLNIEDPLARQIRINISGCPDGCGQHNTANIGFQGAALKNPSGQIPAYEVFLAGSQTYPVRLAHHLKTKVASKRVPETIKALINHYLLLRNDGERFNDFVDRTGIQHFEDFLQPFSQVPPLNKDTINYYIDWERTVLYKVQRGEGECSI